MGDLEGNVGISHLRSPVTMVNYTLEGGAWKGTHAFPTLGLQVSFSLQDSVQNTGGYKTRDGGLVGEGWETAD